MATSLTMCLKALGHEDIDEDEVNRVMGARPMKGARWEEAMAAAQHYGCRATLISPCTIPQLKEWTDQGVPVMISWNPEDRDWSHASVVFDVTDGVVHVADPNIPDPNETVRAIPESEFYGMWGEAWSNYIVRRVAMAIDREITPDGRQVQATSRTAEPYDCYKDGLRGRDLAECYMRFPDDLGPDDVAFIQQYFPNFEGGYSSRPRKRGLADTTKEAIYKSLVAYAIKGLKARKGVSFLNSLLSKGYALSYKQQDWFDKIQRSNASYTRSMPAGIHIKPAIGKVLFDPKKSSAAARKWVEENVGYTEDRGVWSLLGKPAAPEPASRAERSSPSSPAAPSERTTFDRAQTGKMIAILDTLIDKGGPKSGMFRGFKGDLERGKGLTENQLKAIRHNLYKNRMRSEADHFRLASPELVARRARSVQAPGR
jgi:hypothetical protein